MSKKNVLLSIILPVYNSENFLKECLNSLVTNNLSIEIILVDDGSKDNSSIICDKFSTKYDNIKTFHLTNKGVSAARNFGLKHSNGQWIWFVDSDDLVTKSALNSIIENIGLYEPDVLIFKYDILYKNHLYNYAKKHNKKSLINKKTAVNTLILSEYATFPWNKVFKKDVLTRNNIIFPENMIMCEDMEFCLKVYDKSRKFLLDPNVYYIYRKNNNSASFNRNRQRYKNAATANYDFYNYLIKKFPNYSVRLFKNTVVATIAYLHRYDKYDDKYFSLAKFIKKISYKNSKRLGKRYCVEILTFKYCFPLFKMIGTLGELRRKLF